MSSPKGFDPGSLPNALRTRIADAPRAFREWREQVAEDPSLLWHTTTVRVILWLALGICLMLGVRSLVSCVGPGDASLAGFEEPTETATLYVACTDTACRHAFVTEQPLDFADWPLTCEKCGQKTVYRAKICGVCRHWYATVPGAPDQCPLCAADKAEREEKKPKPKAKAKGDDAEDGWGGG
jgi:hypothetical protein